VRVGIGKRTERTMWEELLERSSSHTLFKNLKKGI
jgi:hypothetical protein